MSRRQTILIAGWTLALFVWPASSVAAQRVALAEGDHVRVSWREPGSSSAEGRYVQGSPDSLSFTTREGVRLTVPLASVNRLDVALGFRDRGKEVALGGAAVGVLIGAVVGITTADKQGSPLTDGSYPTLSDPTTSGILGGLAGGLAGAFIGTWIGRSMQTIRWQRVNPTSLNVSVGLRLAR
ncbi:MAG: hypothetical protein JWL95_2779 [Gemmatimonadetes bacterium]|nr:hypothetical protein [Gemmatimonadota bacterium]